MHIGIVIYEDNASLRESLGNLITHSKDLILLGSFPKADQILEQMPSLDPDVILMDIDMPGLNGIEALRLLRTKHQRVQVLMLTVFDDNDHVLDAICAGASGYLLKKYISDSLADAVKKVLEGESPMSPGIARMIVNRMQQMPRQTVNLYNLTPRENEILLHLSRGNSYKLVAVELGISLDTVRSHIKKIYEKLQVHTQTEAIAKAYKERLI